VKIVLDSGAFVGSMVNEEGTARRVIGLWQEGRVTICLSAEILTEYLSVLAGLGLAGTPAMEELLEFFRKRPNIVFVDPETRIRAVAADPGDDKFLECAAAASARCIVAGSGPLLDVKKHGDILIMTPAEFFRRFSDGTLESVAPAPSLGRRFLGRV
jgi:putative PIN family toxin of toxin-antitoxin system